MSFGSTAKILAIDDEVVLRQSLVAYLEDSGFSVLEGVNGKDGLEVFFKEKPDLVLTDLQMPEMGGLEVLATLVEKSPDTPVIVISGAGGMKDVIEALRLGAWDYLTKPITDLAVLEHAICKAMERGRLVAENESYRRSLQRNLDVLEEDQMAGKSVQTSLLPKKNINFGEYSFNYNIEPSLYLSGDFVDYFAIDDKRFGFYVADVSGHGASSAFVTVLVKSIINQLNNNYQMHENDAILDPLALMQQVSREIYAAKLGKYLTMIYGVIDKTTNICDYCVGGHYPNPLLITPNSNPIYLEGSGFPVGIMKEVEFSKCSVEMPPNSSLAMFSDGIMEIMKGESMEEKEAELLKLLVDSKGKVESMLNILGIDKDKKLKLPDDITMLILERSK